LNILIKNSHPILKDLFGQIIKFNTYNKLDPTLVKRKLDYGLKSQYADFLNDLTEDEQELKELLDKRARFSI